MRPLIFFFLLLASCGVRDSPTFELLDDQMTGVQFINELNSTEQFNTYTYRNFYNGGGVAAGDINNDGLIDLYFSGNQQSNRLYLNKGDFRFEDITEAANVSCSGVWSTGVSMADVNGDGWLDIYVCKSGPQEGNNRYNELFINNGDLTFTEKSKEFGLYDVGLSNHAVFFDYDLDNDLDFYLLNNSGRSVGIYDLYQGQREVRDTLGGNKLYRNDKDKFTDVSEEAGIYGSSIGFGLGVTAGDVNGDGWPDLFVSNDFFERDYLYLNQKNGTFQEFMSTAMAEISMGSMGADIADINNDLRPDIFVSEMLPESWTRAKSKSAFEDWDKHEANVRNGFHRQYSRNALHLNIGQQPNSDKTHFSEISRLTNMHATDWSWGALIFDYNNDGQKDVFVANGIYKDLIDQDYINFQANSSISYSKYKEDSLLLTKLIESIPSEPITNYLYENEGNLTFKDVSQATGLDKATFSNGATYADLDNDGDLDLIINNINQPAHIYRNNSEKVVRNNFLTFELVGDNANTLGIGTKIFIYAGEHKFFLEQYPVRGYMSSVDSRPHVGLGKIVEVDSIKLIWPDSRVQVLKNVSSNQILKVYQKESIPFKKSSDSSLLLLKEVRLAGGEIQHDENGFVDFNRDRLLFEMYSNLGARLAVGDITNDGRDDILLGGAMDRPAQVFFQSDDGGFDGQSSEMIEGDSGSEDLELTLADLDGNGYKDLVVASGGNEFSRGDFDLKDRIYFFNQDGPYKKVELPHIGSTSFIKAFDYNSDGDIDLLTGDRLEPFEYGLPGGLHLYDNDGTGIFTDVSKQFLTDFSELGLLTDASILDYDIDGDPDVIIAGEWMNLLVLNNDGKGKFRVDSSAISNNLKGLWKTIETGDFNGDGFQDFFVGNTGLNTRLKARSKEPLTMYVGDFDGNGKLEHLTGIYEKGILIPIHQRHDLIKQLPQLARKYNSYKSYAEASLEDLIGLEILNKAIKLECETTASKLFLGDGDGHFEETQMPLELQFSSIFAAHAMDLNGDGYVDLLTGGNQSKIKPEFGGHLASFGQVFINKHNEEFSFLESEKSGLFVNGEVRDIDQIQIGEKDYVLFSVNNDKLKVYEVGKH